MEDELHGMPVIFGGNGFYFYIAFQVRMTNVCLTLEYFCWMCYIKNTKEQPPTKWLTS